MEDDQVDNYNSENYYLPQEVNPEKWNNDYSCAFNNLISRYDINSAPVIIPKKLFIHKSLDRDGSIQARLDFERLKNIKD